MEIKSISKGEKEFLKHFEEHHHFETLRKEILTKEEAHKTIKDFIQELHKDIENLPEIKKEAEIHHQSLKEVTDVLTQAINFALTEGIIEGLKYISQTRNPHLIDAFHDLLAGHFFKTLVKLNKVKIIQ